MEKKLSELEPGEAGRIVKIDPSIRASVAGMGIRKGKEVKVASEQPVGGPIVIQIEGNKSSLGRRLAESIAVEVER